MMNQLRQIYPRILGIERANGRAEQTKRKTKSTRNERSSKISRSIFSEMTEEQLTANQENGSEKRCKKSWKWNDQE